MIKFQNTEVIGWEHAIRGMRNPMNSWAKSDSGYKCPYLKPEVGHTLLAFSDELKPLYVAAIATIGDARKEINDD